jgi:eukaryotic-like serine/threonine-protein kinase
LGSRASWTDQFQTLESIEFTEGPDARIEGDTATVSFSTRAEHTNRVDTPSLTATLVNEDGEWKIDGLG